MTIAYATNLSRVLALAIGYSPEHIRYNDSYKCIEVKRPWNMHGYGSWHEFSYMDWKTISPIAEKYNCFPTKHYIYWYVYDSGNAKTSGDTPQEAIARAVILKNKRT